MRLSDLRQTLLQQASHAPLQPQSRPPRRRPPVLGLVTRVLDAADRPMRACEVYAAASELYDRPLLWHSVKEALSAYTNGGDQRFRRVSHGIYELAHRSQLQTQSDRTGEEHGSRNERPAPW